MFFSPIVEVGKVTLYLVVSVGAVKDGVSGSGNTRTEARVAICLFLSQSTEPPQDRFFATVNLAGAFIGNSQVVKGFKWHRKKGSFHV